ncbi:MAG TPA: NAD(P)/FAD-dependent oxidoreductase [Burkholderiales bacterium]|nr:NAD(P)/FAD-dependent oxidoreductase [Burkholderiales bacterium]
MNLPEPAIAATRWLAAFDRALRALDDAPLAKLFRADAHWRDLLAFSWEVKTTSGVGNILAGLKRRASGAGARGFEVDPGRTAPRAVTRASADVIEAIFRFDTARGRGSGVVRLAPEGKGWKCWTLLTALDEIRGREESAGGRRPRGEDREPAVLIVGGGHAGLSIAARLKALNVDALIVDRHARVGDTWRRRYHALTLHNRKHVNHLPYMPFPSDWPTYIPKDRLAGWFEAYAESLELDFWSGAEFSGGSYDEKAGRWTVTVRREGGTCTLHPRHVVMATGVSGIPNVPDIPGLANFKGRVVHSHEYDEATAWRGRDALVIGTGTSGHDIAQDLHSSGARVTLVQRSPTLVLNIEPSAQLVYALYSEGPPLDDCDLLTAATPLALLRTAHRAWAEQSRSMDASLLEGLARAGFRLDEEDETGWQFKYLQRGGGYYFNVGCSDLIVEGKIPVVQFADIEGFVAEGAKMRGGEVIPVDLIVLATGYLGLDVLVRRLLGDAVARRVGPIWGFDEDAQELRAMWTRTGQPGLWFIAGSFAQCRIYSKYLALQIKAVEEGLVPARMPRADVEAIT